MENISNSVRSSIPNTIHHNNTQVPTDVDNETVNRDVLQDRHGTGTLIDTQGLLPQSPELNSDHESVSDEQVVSLESPIGSPRGDIKPAQRSQSPEVAVDSADEVVDLRALFDHISLEAVTSPKTTQGVVDAVNEAKQLRATAATMGKLVDITTERIGRQLLVQEYSYGQKMFDRFVEDTGSIFSPSASAGHQLADVNDHAGILIVPTTSGGFGIAERVAVVKDKSGPDAEDRYLVKGYGDRIVPFHAFEQMVTELRHGADPADVTTDKSKTMETEFRTRMRDLSMNSELQVRQTLAESDTPTLMRPLPMDVKPRRDDWDNFEDAMPKGFGNIADTKGTDGNRKDYQFHYDWNKMEQKILLFVNDHYQSEVPRQGEGDRYPTRKAGGAVLAQIEGVAHVEVMGPVGQIGVEMSHTPGVQLDNKLNNPDQETILRITTQDKAIHELRLTPRGAKMTLINPQPRVGHSASGKAFTANEELHVDVDVYSYRGIDTGLHTSASGYADPQLVTSCRDKIPAGPFLIPATGWAKAGINAVSTVGSLVTLQPLRGWVTRSAVASAASTAVKVGVQGGIVYGATSVVNTLRKGVTNTITGAGKAFSASAAGALSAEVQSRLLVSTVLVQEAFTGAVNQVTQRIPDGWKPESKDWRFAVGSGLGALSEFTRLTLNLAIQKGFGLNRGSRTDFAWLGTQASATAATDSLIETTGGHAENHRFLQVFQDALRLCYDVTFRSLGMQTLYDDPSKFIKTFREALSTRVLSRGPDKLLSGMIAHILDANGIIGEHASAYDHQVSYAARFDNCILQMAALADQLGVEAGKQEENFAEWFEALVCVAQVAEKLESIKPELNRITLSAEETRVEQKSDPDFQHASDTSATLNRMRAAEAKSNEQEASSELSDLLKRHGDDFNSKVGKAQKKADDRVMFDANSLSDDVEEQVKDLRKTEATKNSPYPTIVNYDGRTFPTGTVPGRATPVPRDLTTFSETAQGLAKGVHKEMLDDQGVADSISNTGLSKKVIGRVVKAIRAYTVESQLFHYPLRYTFTGQKRVVEVVPGVNYEYNVMQSDRQVGAIDPVNALYVNLGVLHAHKFPGVFYRAVVTDAPYRAVHPNEADDAKLGTAEASKPVASLSDNVVNEGDEVTMTEILSSTGSRRLAASFGNSLGFGSAPTERSQMLVIKQETALNITHVTDLVQAEVINTPGCVFRVTYIDQTGGVDSGTANLSLGQVVYMEQVDTYQWEKDAIERAEKAGASVKNDDVPADTSKRKARDPLIESTSDEDRKKIHDSRAESSGESDPDAKQPALNPAPGKYMTPSGHLYDTTGQADRHVSLKSYFVGNQMEQADDNKPKNRLARWLHPYTSDSAPRATKDAIHAAILTNDPIAEHLDEAIKNPHHEYFRQKGGHYATKAYEVEVALRNSIALNANAAMEPIKQLAPDSDVSAGTQEWMAWLLVSMFRQPIALVEVDVDDNGIAKLKEPPQNGEGVAKAEGSGQDSSKVESDEEDKPPTGVLPTNVSPGQATLFVETYDMVDASLKVDKSPNPAVLIGVGHAGFYAIESHGGERVCRLIGEGGRSAENFMHAYYHGSSQSARPGAYTWSDSKRRYSADSTAQTTARALLHKLQDFASTNYVVLQTAIVDTFKKRYPDVDLDRLHTEFERGDKAIAPKSAGVYADVIPPDAWVACDLRDADNAAMAIIGLPIITDSPVMLMRAHEARDDIESDVRIPLPGEASPSAATGKRELPPETINKWRKDGQEWAQPFLAGMKEGTQLTDAILVSMNMSRVYNNGRGLNCLISSLLQHVTGNYDDSHNAMATVIRATLERDHQVPRGLLHADGPTMAALVNIINNRFHTNICVDVYNPDPTLGLIPQDLAPLGMAQQRVAVILGAEGHAHYEAIRRN